MKTKFRLVTPASFLSGNLRKKLAQAELFAAEDSRFARSIYALDDALPEWLSIDDFDIQLGMSWLPADLLQRFAYEVLAVTARIWFDKYTCLWNVEELRDWQGHDNLITYGLKWVVQKCKGQWIYEDYDRLTGFKLFEMALYLKQPTVKRRKTIDDPLRVDDDLTAWAREKQQRLQERFRQWLKEDDARRKQIEEIYNTLFNSIVPPKYDGSHLSLHGMSPEWQAKLRSRPWQFDDIWRSIVAPHNTGQWQEPGLGKMAICIAIAITAKQIGKASKPLIIVQKPTLQQYRNAFQEIYPGARVLVATPEDCSEAKRQLFLARVAAGNWDAIVLTHQMFQAIPVKAATLRQRLKTQLEAIEARLDKLNPYRNPSGQSRSVRSLMRQATRVEKELRALEGKEDKGLFFEDLGIDYLLADEAHAYKRRSIETSLDQVIGLPVGNSDRADDFALKISILRECYGSDRLVKLTGTPLSNNPVAEAWVELMDLCPDTMQELGLHSYDCYLAQFGQIKKAIEVKPTGVLDEVTRIQDWQNLPELKRLIRSVATIRAADEVGLVRPTPKFIKVVSPMTPLQREFMQDLVERAEAVKRGDAREWLVPIESVSEDKLTDSIVVQENPDTGRLEYFRRKRDNNLYITTDGRKASLDFRLVNPEAQDYLSTKIHRAARRIFTIWKLTRSQRLTQLFACDVGVPSNLVFSVYHALRAELGMMGLPDEEMAFIQDHSKDDDREELFYQFNEGIKSIIFGTREGVGIGCNIHLRMIAIHCLDIPWRADQDEQLLARGIRFGNVNETVRIYRYLTAGVEGNTGFDPFVLQHVERKKRDSFNLLSPDMRSRRHTQEFENPAFSYAELKAIATGDNRIIKLVTLEAELDKNNRILSGAKAELDTILNGKTSKSQGIPYLEKEIDRLEKSLYLSTLDAKAVEEIAHFVTGENFNITLMGEAVTEIANVSIVVSEIIDGLVAKRAFREWQNIGMYGDFVLRVSLQEGVNLSVEIVLKSPHGPKYPVEFIRKPSFNLGAAVEKALLQIPKLCSKQGQELTELRSRHLKLQNEVGKLQRLIFSLSSQISETQQSVLSLKAELGIKSNGENS